MSLLGTSPLHVGKLLTSESSASSCFCRLQRTRHSGQGHRAAAPFPRSAALPLPCHPDVHALPPARPAARCVGTTFTQRPDPATNASRKTRQFLCQAAADFPTGLPQELEEDSKFVRINEDDPRFGPPVMLLLGFASEEVPQVREMLDNMGGEFLQVSVCTQKMAEGTLSSAVHTAQAEPSKVQPAPNLPRVCFLSGLTGEEIMMVVTSWPEAGLEATVFAAMVPNNADKPLKELMEEIMGDHERLSATRR